LRSFIAQGWGTTNLQAYLQLQPKQSYDQQSTIPLYSLTAPS
jgi:hypothetical protein